MERVLEIINTDLSTNSDYSPSLTSINQNNQEKLSKEQNSSKLNLKKKSPGLKTTIASLIALEKEKRPEKEPSIHKSKKKNNDIKNAINTNVNSETKDQNLNLQEIFDKSILELKNIINQKIFTTWFNNIKPISIEHGFSDGEKIIICCLSCPNKFNQEHLKHQYYDKITKSFEIVTGSKVCIKFEVIKDSQKENKKNIKQSREYNETNTNKNNSTGHYQGNNQATNKSNEANLNHNYNFSNFIVGNCNQFAHAACLKVSENPGTAYNPLLIYGGVGLGKTHLANAIGNAARRRNKKVLLVSSEQFVTELISCLKSNSMDKFKSRFRSLDVLIIDDIQFIIGKERTQEEFFHTFNELYGKNKQIIITSDKLPQELIGLEERLRTRFSSGLSVDLQIPDFETRIAILIKKAEVYSLNLSPNVAKILAERIDTNVRELEGALIRLQALCSLFNQEPSEELAKKVVDTISPIKLREITTENIKEIVAKQFNVSINDLNGKRRTQNIVIARQVAMYICRKHTARSFPEIGAIFGGRDHSTVIHAIRTISDRLLTETSLNENIDNIISSLEKK